MHTFARVYVDRRVSIERRRKTVCETDFGCCVSIDSSAATSRVFLLIKINDFQSRILNNRPDERIHVAAEN